MKKIKIFKYIDQLDCFVVDPNYKIIADTLGLTEWNEVVWIGRYFSMDNDNGEHWFDNWSERDKLSEKAKHFGIEYDNLLVIDPDRFKNGFDGSCHTDTERRKFWTDVLKSLELSIDTIVDEAVKFNNERDKTDEEFITDLDNRITEIKNAYL
jgi:hypothetical protein